MFHGQAFSVRGAGVDTWHMPWQSSVGIRWHESWPPLEASTTCSGIWASTLPLLEQEGMGRDGWWRAAAWLLGCLAWSVGGFLGHSSLAIGWPSASCLTGFDIWLSTQEENG